MVLALVLATVLSLDFGPSSGLSTEYRPYFPVFSHGNGRVFNALDSDQALQNAWTHVVTAVAVPLLADKIGGKKALLITGATWITLSILQEAFFHAARTSPQDKAYPSEVRTDLVTRIVPTLLVMGFCL